MNSLLKDFEVKLNSEVEHKTDKYWLDQVGFEVAADGNLNIYVGSEFIKNSIEKKVLKNIEKVYKSIKPGFDCVFILDKSFIKNPQPLDIVEKIIEKEVVEEHNILISNFLAQANYAESETVARLTFSLL